MNADDQEGGVIVKVIVAEGFDLNSQMGGEGQVVAMATRRSCRGGFPNL